MTQPLFRTTCSTSSFFSLKDRTSRRIVAFCTRVGLVVHHRFFTGRVAVEEI